MDEYIDRAVAVSQANFIHGRWDDMYVSAATLMAMPAADVAPVRHGQWIYDKKAQRPYCSVCKGYFYGATNSPMSYCPNCGTKMDEDKV